MTTRAALAFSAVAFAFCPIAAHAGPCEQQLYGTEIAREARLNALGAHGNAAPESTFAMMHRQPTPTTVAEAEERAGEVSGANLTAVEKFLQEARKADAANDLPACTKALAEVRKILGP
jgi:hypothetical protein